MKIKNIIRLFVILSVLITSACSISQKEVTIYNVNEDQKVGFALSEIKSVLEKNGVSIVDSEKEGATINFLLQQKDSELKSEGFRISIQGRKIYVVGIDAAGLMYGGLELAEQIKLYGIDEVKETLQNPYMEKRGTKFNIPLDARSPSYSDASDAAQKNIPEMWNIEFWKQYIDNLARYRFNFISLWSLHPFPSLVKVPEYPDVALNDVHRSKIKWEEHYHLHGTGLDAPEILENVEIVKSISIEEKIDFWKEVMAYAKNRNIDFFIVTWNIFTNGIDGKYGITDEINNQTTKDYFKESVKQMFLTYPDLAGIGLTTGENMPGAGFEEKEDWAYETYAQGLMEAADEMPDRKFVFIHRQHQAGAKDIVNKFQPLIEKSNIEFLFSFKYAQAHVFSATTQPFHEKFVEDIGDMKTIWTLRNDDNYYFRWGAPDFVREFIQNIPKEVSRGFYYGSDQWIWGREFTMKEAESPRQLEILKHWYHWMMWGRLGYNPELSNERFIQILQQRFPEIDANELFVAWQNASMTYPVTTGFHWGALDFQWYIEGCKSRKEFARNETGFHDVNRFISLPPHPKSGFQSIPDYVKMITSNGNSELKSPFDVAVKLHQQSDSALAIVENFDGVTDKELKIILNDIKSMAFLGKYYAHKIAGATYLALYRETNDKQNQLDAVEELTKASDSWDRYTETASQQNINPIWTNRVGYVDWKQMSEWVDQDVEIAKDSTKAMVIP